MPSMQTGTDPVTALRCRGCSLGSAHVLRRHSGAMDRVPDGRIDGSLFRCPISGRRAKCDSSPVSSLPGGGRPKASACSDKNRSFPPSSVPTLGGSASAREHYHPASLFALRGFALRRNRGRVPGGGLAASGCRRTATSFSSGSVPRPVDRKPNYDIISISYAAKGPPVDRRTESRGVHRPRWTWQSPKLSPSKGRASDPERPSGGRRESLSRTRSRAHPRALEGRWEMTK